VSSVKRSGAAPDLPTMIEMGYPGFDAVPWFGLMAPAGTPEAVTDKIYAETMRVLAQPDVRKQFATLGIDVIGGTPAEFAAVIPAEIRQWAKLIKAMGIDVIE
jgi:tripartite-type tricarboxylate transporter receptor subunit TctC